MMHWEEALKIMVEESASDLFLKPDHPPWIKVGGRMKKLGGVVGEKDMEDALRKILGERYGEFFEKRDLDLTFIWGEKRFRINAFFERGNPVLVFREVRKDIPSFEELHLPGQVLRKLCGERRGMILITGPAGCGKSTTLASMIEYINLHFSYHVITIEDPVEFLFENKRCLINQREVGRDTHSFHRALRSVVREAPDVIMIGEMRDRITLEAGLNAAETGSLVLTTLHTMDAPETVERILSFFSPGEEDQIRFRLSHLLKGILSQRLLTRKDGKGLIPAYAILLGTPTVRKLIQERRIQELYSLMEEGTAFGMCTFTQTLYGLVREGKVEKEEALAVCPQPEELKRRLEGIFTR